MDTKRDKKGQKKTSNYYCEYCDYSTCHKNKFARHLSTLKHSKRTNGIKMVQNGIFLSLFEKKGQQDNCSEFVCECGKSYRYNSGLYRHKSVCKIINKDDNIATFKGNNSNKSNENNLIVDLLKKMDEKDKQIMELIPKVGNNNTTNNTNQFNLNVFLKEDCKDAINWNEFINSIELDLNCLTELKNSNITKGITDIICNKINELGIYKRPIHCVDQKRKKLCIKNEKEWENDEECVNALLNKGDKNLQHKYIKLINDWENSNPNWINNEQLAEEYAQISNKIYQELDENKHRSELIKEVIIPK